MTPSFFARTFGKANKEGSQGGSIATRAPSDCNKQDANSMVSPAQHKIDWEEKTAEEDAQAAPQSGLVEHQLEPPVDGAAAASCQQPKQLTIPTKKKKSAFKKLFLKWKQQFVQPQTAAAIPPHGHIAHPTEDQQAQPPEATAAHKAPSAAGAGVTEQKQHQDKGVAAVAAAEPTHQPVQQQQQQRKASRLARQGSSSSSQGSRNSNSYRHSPATPTPSPPTHRAAAPTLTQNTNVAAANSIMSGVVATTMRTRTQHSTTKPAPSEPQQLQIPVKPLEDQIQQLIRLDIPQAAAAQPTTGHAPWTGTRLKPSTPLASTTGLAAAIAATGGTTTSKAGAEAAPGAVAGYSHVAAGPFPANIRAAVSRHSTQQHEQHDRTGPATSAALRPPMPHGAPVRQRLATRMPGAAYAVSPPAEAGYHPHNPAGAANTDARDAAGVATSHQLQPLPAHCRPTLSPPKSPALPTAAAAATEQSSHAASTAAAVLDVMTDSLTDDDVAFWLQRCAVLQEKLSGGLMAADGKLQALTARNQLVQGILVSLPSESRPGPTGLVPAGSKHAHLVHKLLAERQRVGAEVAALKQRLSLLAVAVNRLAVAREFMAGSSSSSMGAADRIAILHLVLADVADRLDLWGWEELQGVANAGAEGQQLRELITAATAGAADHAVVGGFGDDGCMDTGGATTIPASAVPPAMQVAHRAQDNTAQGHHTGAVAAAVPPPQGAPPQHKHTAAAPAVSHFAVAQRFKLGDTEQRRSGAMPACAVGSTAAVDDGFLALARASSLRALQRQQQERAMQQRQQQEQAMQQQQQQQRALMQRQQCQDDQARAYPPAQPHQQRPPYTPSGSFVSVLSSDNNTLSGGGSDGAAVGDIPKQRRCMDRVYQRGATGPCNAPAPAATGAADVGHQHRGYDRSRHSEQRQRLQHDAGQAVRRQQYSRHPQQQQQGQYHQRQQQQQYEDDESAETAASFAAASGGRVRADDALLLKYLRMSEQAAAGSGRGPAAANRRSMDQPQQQQRHKRQHQQQRRLQQGPYDMYAEQYADQHSDDESDDDKHQHDQLGAGASDDIYGTVASIFSTAAANLADTAIASAGGGGVTPTSSTTFHTPAPTGTEAGYAPTVGGAKGQQVDTAATVGRGRAAVLAASLSAAQLLINDDISSDAFSSCLGVLQHLSAEATDGAAQQHRDTGVTQQRQQTSSSGRDGLGSGDDCRQGSRGSRSRHPGTNVVSYPLPASGSTAESSAAAVAAAAGNTASRVSEGATSQRSECSQPASAIPPTGRSSSPESFKFQQQQPQQQQQQQGDAASNNADASFERDTWQSVEASSSPGGSPGSAEPAGTILASAEQNQGQQEQHQQQEQNLLDADAQWSCWGFFDTPEGAQIGFQPGLDNCTAEHAGHSITAAEGLAAGSSSGAHGALHGGVSRHVHDMSTHAGRSGSGASILRQPSVESTAATAAVAAAGGGTNVPVTSTPNLTVKDLLSMLTSALQAAGPSEDLVNLPVSSLLQAMQHQHQQ